MQQVKMGIIGYGNMGTAHAKSLLENQVPGMILTAVADRQEARRTAARSDLPSHVEIFDQGEALIAGGSCDAVLVAVPHYQHPELSQMAFEAGLHVMCEKPAGVYTLQVREMNQAAQQSDRVFGMMFNQRTNCLYRAMRDIVVSGEMGAIKRVNWIVTDWYRTKAYYDSGNWRATWEGEGGGVLLNQCPHNLDLLQWICGMPNMVRAFCHYGKWHDIEVEDDVTAYLEFPGGATGVFVTTTGDLPGTNRLELTMEMGKLVCEDGKLMRYQLEVNEREFCVAATSGFATQTAAESQVETDGENLQHVGVLRAFAGNILRGEPLVARGEEGINGLQLSNAIHLSSWLGESVAIPFDEELFLQELNKRRATSRKKQGQEVFFDTTTSY